MHTNRNFEKSRKHRDADQEYTPRATMSGHRRKRRMIRRNVCPDCGARLVRVNGHYYCQECPGVSIGRSLMA
jgi:hypothetical protein